MKKGNKKTHTQYKENTDVVYAFFYKNQDLIYFYKKTEKIVTALFLATSHIKDTESIKGYIRDISLKLMSSVFSMKDAVETYQRYCMELVSALEIAEKATIISSANYQILKGEFLGILELLRNNGAASFRGQVELSATLLEVDGQQLRTRAHANNTYTHGPSHGYRKGQGRRGGATFVGMGDMSRNISRQMMGQGGTSSVSNMSDMSPLPPVDNFESGEGGVSHPNKIEEDRAIESFRNTINQYNNVFNTRVGVKNGDSLNQKDAILGEDGNGHFPLFNQHTSAHLNSEDGKMHPDSPLDRKSLIISIIKDMGEVAIKDISQYMPEYSEKTIQRDLIAMVEANVLKKTGERRWSRYSLEAPKVRMATAAIPPTSPQASPDNPLLVVNPPVEPSHSTPHSASQTGI